MSTRITGSMMQRSILSDVTALDDKLSKTQEREASGKQITKPSDDPFNTGRAMALRSSLAANAQQQRNVQDAQGWQDATETALGSITDAVQRANDLLTSAANGTNDQSSLNAIADELEQIVGGIKDDANASYNGVYLFAGTKTTTPPYPAGADDTYQGDQGGLDPAVPGVVREIGPGVSMSINTVGQEVLGDGAGKDSKLLATLRAAIADARSGNTAALGGADLTNLKANLDQVLSVRSRNGAQSNRLSSALDRLQQVSQTTTGQLSDIEDADLAQTLTDYSTQSAAYTAALRAGASIVQTSLLDFLS
jgi:flagellar hook-associated protein 3 FlgL